MGLQKSKESEAAQQQNPQDDKAHPSIPLHDHERQEPIRLRREAEERSVTEPVSALLQCLSTPAKEAMRAPWKEFVARLRVQTNTIHQSGCVSVTYRGRTIIIICILVEAYPQSYLQ